MKKELKEILDNKFFCDICGEDVTEYDIDNYFWSSKSGYIICCCGKCYRALKKNVKSPVIVEKRLNYIG